MSYEDGPAAPLPTSSWPAPPSPPPPPSPDAGASPARTGRHKTVLAFVAVAVASWGIGLGMGLTGQDDSDSAATSPPAASASHSDDEDRDDPPETTTTTEPPAPTPADFAVTIVTLEKSCFGSAGCNVTYTVELAYNGLRPLDPSDTWQVIYDISGGEQVKTESIEVTGDSYTYNEESFISTPNETSVLAATVTTVREL